MPDVYFQIEGAVATPNAASPQITFKLRINNASSDSIHSIALRVQVQIEPVRRRYSPAEQALLKDLFGEPERWSTSLQPLLWANVNIPVPSFDESTVVDVNVPCTFDFNIGITKYIYGLENGELPTSFLFSGTTFYPTQMGLQVSQIPWSREASFRLPVSTWKQMMDFYYPNTAWLMLRRDVFERLSAFRSRHGISNWDQVVERMLGMAAQG